jgi:hypothetical protein
LILRKNEEGIKNSNKKERGMMMKKRFTAGIFMSVMAAMCLGGCQGNAGTVQTTAGTVESRPAETAAGTTETAENAAKPSVSISVGFENGMADTMSKAVEQ